MDFPETIGRYTVLLALGEGGMGRVLLGRDSVLGRLVAIKVLRDDLGMTAAVKAQLEDRMRHEARAAAALSHPHMVTLHDMGEEPGVGLYLVFEYIDGPTLRDIVRAGAMNPSDVARLARELGSALQCAHDAGVIHRDVKPENIMLARTGAKLTDFGIARVPDSTLTSAGSVLGTPAYSAPEALAIGDFSPQSDQFSFAVTLYEALAGRRAFVGDDALTVATRVATESPPPLLAYPRADAVLSRALSKDSARRYESCAAFGEALAVELERRAELTTSAPPTYPPHSASSPSGAFRLDTGGTRSSLIPRQTRRWHNVFAALGVLVITALILMGRRTQDATNGASLKEVASAFGSAIAPYSPPVLPPPPRPRDARSSSFPLRDAAAIALSGSASAAPLPSSSAAASSDGAEQASSAPSAAPPTDVASDASALPAAASSSPPDAGATSSPASPISPSDAKSSGAPSPLAPLARPPAFHRGSTTAR